MSHNRGAESARWFKYMKEKYPDAAPPGQPLDEYCLRRLAGNVAELSNDKTKALLEGMVLQYYFNLALGEDDRAEGLDLMARKIRELYAEASRARPGALQMDTVAEFKQRILSEILAPNSGWSGEAVARLRTRLNLPVPTNTPPAPKP